MLDDVDIIRASDETMLDEEKQSILESLDKEVKGVIDISGVKMRNFQQQEKTRFLKAVNLLKNVLNDAQFKEDMLKLNMTEKNGKSNKEIYKLIMHGKDKYNRKEDFNIDIDVTMYHKRTSKTIGYTYPSTRRTWLNRKYFKRMNLAKLAGHIMHEYCHNLGFKHKGIKRFSVPYQLGRLVKQLAAQLIQENELSISRADNINSMFSRRAPNKGTDAVKPNETSGQTIILSKL